MIRPLYSAGMTLRMPGEALTALTPTIDARIEKPPSTSGSTTAASGASTTTIAPSAMVAISVTA